MTKNNPHNLCCCEKRNLCMYRCMKYLCKVNFEEYLIIKRICKTYIKTIAKYIQVPPMLNFLCSSFSALWLIYLTARINSTFISISTIQKKIVHHWVDASSQWPALQLA